MKNAGFKIILALVLLALAGFFVKSSLDYVNQGKSGSGQMRQKTGEKLQANAGRQMGEEKKGSRKQGKPGETMPASGSVQLGAEGSSAGAETDAAGVEVLTMLHADLAYLVSSLQANLSGTVAAEHNVEKLEKLNQFSQVYRQKLMRKNRQRAGEYNQLAAGLRDNAAALLAAGKEGDKEKTQELLLNHMQICLDCHQIFKKGPGEE